MNVNNIFFGGNLTSQPELKSLPSGTKVCAFSLASNRKWKDNNGELREETEFGNCVLFGSQAEALAKYAVKGQSILVEGRIQTRSWEDKDTGKKLYRTEIAVARFHFGQKPKGADGTGHSHAKPIGEEDAWGGNDDAGFDQFANVPEKKTKKASSNTFDGIDYGESINPDDIPF